MRSAYYEIGENMFTKNKKGFLVAFSTSLLTIFVGLGCAFANFTAKADFQKSNAVSANGNLNTIQSLEALNGNVWKTNALSLERFTHENSEYGADNALVFSATEENVYLETAGVYENFSFQFSVYANDLLRNGDQYASAFRITYGNWKFTFPTGSSAWLYRGPSVVYYDEEEEENTVVLNGIGFPTLINGEILKYRLEVKNGEAALYFTEHGHTVDVANELVSAGYHNGNATIPEYKIEHAGLVQQDTIRVELDNDNKDMMSGRLLIGDIRLVNLDGNEKNAFEISCSESAYAFGGNGLEISVPTLSKKEFVGVSLNDIALKEDEYVLTEENGEIVNIRINDSGAKRVLLLTQKENANIVVYTKTNYSKPLTVALENLPSSSVTFVMPNGEEVVKTGTISTLVTLPDTENIDGFIGWYTAEGKRFDVTDFRFETPITLYGKTADDLFSVSFWYADAFGRDIYDIREVAYGTNVAEYVSENLSIGEYYGYRLIGWDTETIAEAADVTAIYEKLKGNGGDIALDFSKKPESWELKDYTGAHSGGFTGLTGGYFRTLKATAGSRLVTAQTYTDFELEFDIVELNNIMFGGGKEQIMMIEFGLNDAALGQVSSNMRLLFWVNKEQNENGDIFYANFDGTDAYQGGTLKHSAYNREEATIIRYDGGDGVTHKMTNSGTSPDGYHITLKLRVEGGWAKIWSKTNSMEAYDAEPDIEFEIGDKDTSGYVSISGYSSNSNTDTLLSFDNYKLTNLAPRESEVTLEIPDIAKNENGRYVYDTKQGDLPVVIDLHNQSLFASLSYIDGKLVSSENVIKEDFDEIIEDMTLGVKILNRIYLANRDKANADGYLDIDIKFMSTSDACVLPISIKVPAQATVKFYDGETLLSETTKNLGETVSFPSLNMGTRVFIGWQSADGELIETENLLVVTDESYTAVFKKQYTVKFLDADGNVIKTEIVNEKESASEPKLEKTGYALSWEGGNYLYVTEDMETKAVWTREAGGATEQSGCRSSVGSLSACIVALGIAVVYIGRKERDVA